MKVYLILMNFVVMDPSKTELTWFPKTRGGDPMQNTALYKVKPKGQIIVNQFYYFLQDLIHIHFSKFWFTKP